jgi:hypothetical protein
MRDTSPASKVSPLVVGYVVVVEALYAMYFSALPSTPPDGTGPALVLGLLLVVIAIPGSLVAALIQGALDSVFGYNGFRDPLWPNLVAFQIGIAINAYLLHRLTRRTDA